MQYQEIERHYWRTHGYDEADLVRAFEESKPEDLLALITVEPDKQLHAEWKSGEMHGNLVQTIKFLEQAFDLLLDKPAKFLVCYHDAFYASRCSDILKTVPVLAYAKLFEDCGTILIPDPLFELNQGYHNMRMNLPDGAMPKWEDREPVLFWRGSMTGFVDSTTGRNDRKDAVKKCKGHANTDVYLTNLGNMRDKYHIEAVMGADVLRTPVMQDEFFKYRYQLDLPGNAATWSFFWKLLCGSCVVHVPGNTRAWFHEYLRPWKHYIPATVEELPDLAGWMLTHDEECHEIARAAQNELALLGYQSTIRLYKSLFTDILATRINA